MKAALHLYDWNSAVSGALHEDLGRVEVVLRNALDGALVRHGTASHAIRVAVTSRRCVRGGATAPLGTDEGRWSTSG
jgi:hypothetical protein